MLQATNLGYPRIGRQRELKKAGQAREVQLLATQSIITVTCGLGLLPLTPALEIFRTTAQLAMAVRKVALSSS